jgi:ZIP family zinc transporter
MKKAGRKTVYILGVWGSIAIISGISAIAGFTVFAGFSDSFIASSIAFAAGAILAMIVDTMIPEAFEETHTLTGIITVIGFLTAFFLTNLQK